MVTLLLNLEEHLRFVLVTRRLNTLVSVQVTTQLVSHLSRKLFLLIKKFFIHSHNVVALVLYSILD